MIEAGIGVNLGDPGCDQADGRAVLTRAAERGIMHLLRHKYILHVIHLAYQSFNSSSEGVHCIALPWTCLVSVCDSRLSVSSGILGQLAPVGLACLVWQAEQLYNLGVPRLGVPRFLPMVNIADNGNTKMSEIVKHTRDAVCGDREQNEVVVWMLQAAGGSD